MIVTPRLMPMPNSEFRSLACGARDRHGAQTCAGRLGEVMLTHHPPGAPQISLYGILRRQTDGSWDISDRNKRRRIQGRQPRLRRSKVHSGSKDDPLPLRNFGRQGERILRGIASADLPVAVHCPRCGTANELTASLLAQR